MSDHVWKDNREELRALWLSPLSAREIGEKLGAGKNAIIGAVNRARAAEGEDRWPVRNAPRTAAMVRGRKKRAAEAKTPRAAPRVVSSGRKYVFGTKAPKTTKAAQRVRQGRQKASDLPATRLYLDCAVGVHCEYIDEEIGRKPITEVRCCGRSVEFGFSWCEGHRSIVFGGLSYVDYQRARRHNSQLLGVASGET